MRTPNDRHVTQSDELKEVEKRRYLSLCMPGGDPVLEVIAEERHASGRFTMVEIFRRNRIMKR